MIDRNRQPNIKPAERPELPSPDKFVLDNGIPVYLLKAGNQDVCRIDFMFRAGTWEQQVPLQSAMTNAMLQEGTSGYSSGQIAEVFDFHGAYLQLYSDQHFGTVSVISLSKHLPRLFPVLEDLLKRSVFPRSEFETLIERRKQRFSLENEKVKVLCQKKLSEILFGKEHPYSQSVTLSDFKNLNLRTLIDFYKDFYHSGNCEVLVAGQFGTGVTDLLNRHVGGSDWAGMKKTAASFEIISSAEKQIRIGKPDAIQSAIRTGRIMVKKDHPDYLPLQVLVTILGGYFSSRLMSNIREEKGFTYGIGASLISLGETGYLVIATEVDRTYVEDTLAEIKKELEKLCLEKVGKEELGRVRQYLLGEFVRDLDGPFALAQSFRDVHEFGLGFGFYEKYYDTIMNIQAEQLQQLAVTYLNPESFYTVVAGKEP